MSTGVPQVSASPVFAVLPRPTLIDYPGELASVFFLCGCNFSCGFCHNLPLRAASANTILWHDLGQICSGLKNDWVGGVVITGGEPTISLQLGDLIQFVKDRGFKVKLDTNGSQPGTLQNLLPHVDYVALDIKCSLAAYSHLTGYSHPERIRESVKVIKEQARDYEFRTTVVETFHTDAEMIAISELVSGAKRYVLQPFVPRPDLLDRRFSELPRTPSSRLAQIKSLISGCASEICIREQ